LSHIDQETGFIDREEFLSSWNLVKTEDEEKADSQGEAAIESGATSADREIEDRDGEGVIK
jgi:hypothetical protein